MEQVIVRGSNKKTIMNIIAGELTNWGYKVSEPMRSADDWGEDELKLEVKDMGE